MWSVDKQLSEEDAAAVAAQKVRIKERLMILLHLSQSDDESAADTDDAKQQAERLDLVCDFGLFLAQSYCHRYDLPQCVEPVLVALCLDLYRQNTFGGNGGQCGAVKAVRRGDVSISYQLDENGQAALLKDYGSQLSCCRRLVW